MGVVFFYLHDVFLFGFTIMFNMAVQFDDTHLFSVSSMIFSFAATEKRVFLPKFHNQKSTLKGVSIRNVFSMAYLLPAPFFYENAGAAFIFKVLRK